MRIASDWSALADGNAGLKLYADEGGASLIEYAIVLGMVSVGAIAALTFLGNNAAQTLTSAASTISS